MFADSHETDVDGTCLKKKGCELIDSGATKVAVSKSFAKLLVK